MTANVIYGTALSYQQTHAAMFILFLSPVHSNDDNNADDEAACTNRCTDYQTNFPRLPT